MGNMNVDILTYEPYWYECDTCGYVTGSHEKLSQVMFEVAAHRKEWHKPVYRDVPAPMKPSQVLAQLREVTA